MLLPLKQWRLPALKMQVHMWVTAVEEINGPVYIYIHIYIHIICVIYIYVYISEFSLILGNGIHLIGYLTYLAICVACMVTSKL